MAHPRLPDFLLVGAMKSGTTSLHLLLDHHPGIFIPRDELFFFDLDDAEQHPDFFSRAGGGQSFPDYDAGFERHVAWYAARFDAARPEQLVGEDTTTYFHSARAPERIRALLPEVRIVVLLRDPVARAVSHYWHLVERRRAVATLEDMLEHAPETLLQRGHYKEQLERYLHFFPREHVKVVLFERFVADVQGTVDAVCAFLGLPASVDTRGVPTWSNRTRYPRSLRLQLAFNRLVRPVMRRRWLADAPGARSEDAGDATAPTDLRQRVVRVIGGVDRLNLGGGRPPLDPRTRTFLAQYFARQNAGLSALVGEDVTALWPNLAGYTL